MGWNTYYSIGSQGGTLDRHSFMQSAFLFSGTACYPV